MVWICKCHTTYLILHIIPTITRADSNCISPASKPATSVRDLEPSGLGVAQQTDSRAPSQVPSPEIKF